MRGVLRVFGVLGVLEVEVTAVFCFCHVGVPSSHSTLVHLHPPPCKSLTTAAHILATAAKTKIARICVV